MMTMMIMTILMMMRIGNDDYDDNDHVDDNDFDDDEN